MSATFLVLTVLWKDWIEIVFRVDADHHSGSLEWAFVVSSATVTTLLVVLAYREWRRERLLAMS
jgi:hypothetical protein